MSCEKAATKESTEPNHIHGGSELYGSIGTARIQSRALGLQKKYRFYLPPNYDQNDDRFPVLYLFRGHEREWCNISEDSTRNGTTVCDIVDQMIVEGRIQPVILIMPGVASDDNSIPGLGIDMYSPHLAKHCPGIGKGHFEKYLIGEMLPHVDTHFRTIPDRTKRALDGFSLGGFTAMYLVATYPELFGSAGCYDGTLMWRGGVDPRKEDGVDTTWMVNPMFDAAFGKPRSTRFMAKHNPTDIIVKAQGGKLRFLRTIPFHIQCAAFDENRGNIDRARHFVHVLESKGLVNSFRDVVLSPTAGHSWKFADAHMKQTLPLHDAVFSTH